MKSTPLESFRTSVREWLFCWDSLHSAVNLVLAVVLLIVSLHVQSPLGKGLILLVFAYVAHGPVWYFLFPPLAMAVLVLLVKFGAGKNQAEYLVRSAGTM